MKESMVNESMLTKSKEIESQLTEQCRFCSKKAVIIANGDLGRYHLHFRN